MYQIGEGIEQNSKKAKELFLKSAVQGNENAKKALATINMEDKVDEYSKQRMSDVYLIASLLEEYKEIAGHYPFYDLTPAQEGHKKIGTLVTIGSSIAEESFAKKPNPFQLSAARANSSHLRRKLEQKLERKVALPVDPQEIAIYAPNAYYVYFPAENDEYLIMAFLYNANSYTSELFNSHANVYAIASSHVVGEDRFWSSAGIKPRIFKEIKLN